VLSTQVVCPILIGREAYFQPLTQLLRQTQTGPLRVALLAGEAGIGKTRLTTELKQRAAEFEIWQAHCFEAEQSLPYAPFLDLLRAFCAAHSAGEIAQAFGSNLAAQTQTAGPLLTLLPELTVHLPHLAAPPAIEPEQEKRRLFQSFTTFFTHARRASPLLLILEDWHWSDEASLELLLHLTRRLSAQPVLVVMTYRAGEAHTALHRLLAEWNRARVATEFSLRRLNLSEVEVMLRAILGPGQPVHTAFITTVHTLTEGNPFFIEEIVKSLFVSGAINTHTHAWAADLHIPRTVQEAVTRQTQAVSEAARAVLARAAVLGQRFEFALLQTLTQISEATLLKQIKELVGAQLLIEEAPDVFAFRHALIRQAVLATLLTRERKALHFQAAEVMEQLYASATEAHAGELAYHFSQAEVWGKALGYAQLAGEQAVKFYSPRAAVEHFTRALAAAQALSAPLPLPALFRARGQAYATLGEFDTAREDYEHARQAAQAEHNLQEAWQSVLALGFHWVQRDMAHAGEYFQQALTLAQTMNDSATVAHSLNRLGNWQMMTEQPSAARQSHQQALAIFQSIHNQPGLAETFDLLGITSISLGDLAGGAAAYERAIALFRELGNQTGLTSALTMSALCCAQYLANQAYVSERNRQPECIAHAEEALRLARQIEWRSAEALVLTILGQALSANGEYGRALSSMQAGLALAQLIEHQQWQLNAHLVLGALYLDVLDVATAHPHLQEAARLAEAIGSLYWKRTVTGFLASALVRSGQLTEAAATLEAGRPSNASFVTMGERHSWAAQVELHLAQNQPEQALIILEQLRAALPNAPLHHIPRLAHLHAQTLWALGHPAQAETALQAALAAAQDQGAPQWQWRIHATHAHWYAGQRRWAQAETAITTGKKILEMCAASLSEGPVRQNFLSRAAEFFPTLPKASARQKAKQQFGGLTAREREIAAQVAHGKTNRAIAEALVVSERTVEKHIENIMGKLGVETRVQVAAWALARGLLPSPTGRGAGGGGA
jgi:predicted ATPase/DNA-binding CsgD family transcriptional regulator